MAEHTPPAGQPATDVDESPAEPALSTTDPNPGEGVQPAAVEQPAAGLGDAAADEFTQPARRPPPQSDQQRRRAEATERVASAATHYDAAEALLDLADATVSEVGSERYVRKAQVHATLATVQR